MNDLAHGGVEQLLLDVVQNIDHSAFEIDVAFLDEEPLDLLYEFEQTGCSVYWLRGKGRYGLGWIARLRRLVDERQTDVVHGHYPYSAVGARLGLVLTGRPILYTEHCVWDAYRVTPLTYWGNLLTFSRNTTVFAVSDRVLASLEYPPLLRFLRMPPVRTLYHGVDVAALARMRMSERDARDELDVAQGVPVIGSVANFRQTKGHRYLLGAFQRVLHHLPDAVLVLVGRGPTEGSIREAARDLGISSRVLFAGYRAHAARVMPAFDVFALPSLHEGLPIALIEAMAIGRPCVVTPVGGVAEILTHGKHGLIVPPADSPALADALVTLLTDESLRDRYGTAAQARAATFDIRVTVRVLEGIYRRYARSENSSSESY